MLRSVAARLVIVARRAAHLPAVSLKGSVEPVAPTYIQSNILCRASSSLGWVSRTSTLLSAVAHKTDAPGTDLTEEYEHATGLEKEEIEAQLEEEPAIVESQFDERIVGCSGGVDDVRTEDEQALEGNVPKAALDFQTQAAKVAQEHPPGTLQSQQVPPSGELHLDEFIRKHDVGASEPLHEEAEAEAETEGPGEEGSSSEADEQFAKLRDLLLGGPSGAQKGVTSAAILELKALAAALQPSPGNGDNGDGKGSPLLALWRPSTAFEYDEPHGGDIAPEPEATQTSPSPPVPAPALTGGLVAAAAAEEGEGEGEGSMPHSWTITKGQQPHEGAQGAESEPEPEPDTPGDAAPSPPPPASSPYPRPSGSSQGTANSLPSAETPSEALPPSLPSPETELASQEARGLVPFHHDDDDDGDDASATRAGSGEVAAHPPSVLGVAPGAGASEGGEGARAPPTREYNSMAASAGAESALGGEWRGSLPPAAAPEAATVAFAAGREEAVGQVPQQNPGSMPLLAADLSSASEAASDGGGAPAGPGTRAHTQTDAGSSAGGQVVDTGAGTGAGAGVGAAATPDGDALKDGDGAAATAAAAAGAAGSQNTTDAGTGSAEGGGNVPAAAGQWVHGGDGYVWLDGDGVRRLEEEKRAGAAQFLLGVLSATGVLPHHAPLNDSLAVEQLTRAAHAGSLHAWLALANRYYQGRGVQKSCMGAMWYLKAAAHEVLRATEEAGDYSLPKSSVRLRDRLREGSAVARAYADDTAEQVELDEELAQRGVPEFQRHMGYRHLLGRGIQQDNGDAFRLFEAAAVQGDDVAAFNLGYMHMKGLSTPVNYTAARHLFLRAAERRLPSAYNGLGVLHFNGWGTPVNYTLAREYFARAAQRNDPDGLSNMGSIYLGGYGVEKDVPRALRYFEQAADAGHWRAPFALALLYAEGKETPLNCSLAVRLFSVFVIERGSWPRDLQDATEAYDAGHHWAALVRFLVVAEQGSLVAMENAAFMLRRAEGFDGPGKQSLMLELLARAGKLGSAIALIELGHLHFQDAAGHNASRVVDYYEQAAAAGEPEAFYSLAYMHQHGLRSLPQNLSRARELLERGLQFAVDEEVVPLTLALYWLKLHSLALTSWGVMRAPLAGLLHQLERLHASVLTATSAGPPQMGGRREAASGGEPISQEGASSRLTSLVKGWDTVLIFVLTVALIVVYKVMLRNQASGAEESARLAAQRPPHGAGREEAGVRTLGSGQEGDSGAVLDQGDEIGQLGSASLGGELASGSSGEGDHVDRSRGSPESLHRRVARQPSA
eukprot:jgi/Mesen1/9985/ME000072S09396